MEQDQTEVTETIYERIEDLRRQRNADARLCTKALLADDIDSAGWFARSFQAHSESLEELERELQESLSDRTE